MKYDVQIAPSILSADFSKMGEELRRMEDCGADLIHCDVMDGMFVPNITFGSKMIADLRKCTTLPLDVHLMVTKPERYVDDFIKAGADFVTVHVEASENTEGTLRHIREAGVKCGIVINPETDVEPWLYSLPLCDMVLLMSVHPGFGGQKFIADTLEKVVRVREEMERIHSDALLEIDGGVTEANISEILKAGANVIVAGSTVFGSQNPADTIQKLRG